MTKLAPERYGSRWTAGGLAFKRKRTAVAWCVLMNNAPDFYKGTDEIKDACASFARDEGAGWLIMCLKNAGAKREPAWWPKFYSARISTKNEDDGSK